MTKSANTPARAPEQGKTRRAEAIARERQDLLNATVAGGMMGGYLEPGYPLYFVNERMLQYLGYASEEEFEAGIGGFILNLIHPEDRERVERTVEEGIAGKGEYSVEYRIRKKGGGYLWVHDVGRCVVSEDGRRAVISVSADITAQKLAQQEVLNLYNNIPGAVFRCRFNEEWTVIEANDGLFQFLGYTREEFAAMGNKMAAVIHPDDLEVMTGRITAQLARGGNRIENENRLICKDGAVKWISIKAELSTDEGGEQFFYCVFVDITQQMEVRLRQAERYRQELNYSMELEVPNLLAKVQVNVTKDQVQCHGSPGGTVDEGNSVYHLGLEQMADSAIGEDKRREILDTFRRETVLRDFAKGTRAQYNVEFRRRLRDGTPIWCSTTARSYQNPETGDIMLFMYSFDITRQKITQKILQRSVDVSYDYIADVDLERDWYHIVSWNKNAETAPPEEGSFREENRRFIERSVVPEDREKCRILLDAGALARRLEQEGVWTIQFTLREEGEEPRVKRLRCYYTDKTLGRICMSRTDITDIVRQEQKQKEALAAALAAAEQASAAKSDFLSRMSHEIRTPMNAIIGMSAIAAQSIGDDERVADCISKIGISSRFLLSLINDILDMSRIESGKMLLKSEKIPTEEFLGGVNSICYAQASAKGVDFECIVDPALDDYYIGDAMKLQQVLINILSNAVKFTKPGGKVTFSASQRRRTKNDAELRFIVNDTGVGMSEEFLPHIFEPFSQESTGTTAIYGGTGLGLAICKSIVDMMDGSISVRSIRGIGSEFTVDVKLSITEEAKRRHSQKQQAFEFANLKTLVVDDDVAVCESAVITLREMGVDAQWVDSGRKAVERVRELWDEQRHFDMLLIDWKMPEMDGIETARRIRRIVGPEVTIIIMTAYDWASIEHEAKLAGVNLLMSKPMFKSSLISAFTRAMGRQEEACASEPPQDFDFSGKRVLLVEDHPLNTEIAMQLLTQKGMAVDTAENGLRAIELFSKSPQGYYAAILMDIRMPIMDGLTASSSIRHLTNPDAGTIPIIAMTANAFDEDIEKSKRAGMNAHLAKPIEPRRLYQTLYDFIYGKEGDGE